MTSSVSGGGVSQIIMVAFTSPFQARRRYHSAGPSREGQCSQLDHARTVSSMLAVMFPGFSFNVGTGSHSAKFPKSGLDDPNTSD